MLEIIDQATAATQKEDWSLVNQYLQQLPVEPKAEEFTLLNSEDITRSLNLGLQVLQMGDFQQRWEVAKFFPQLEKLATAYHQEELIYRSLMGVLQDEEIETEIRWFAARILGQFDDPGVILSLVELLEKTEDDDLAAIAAEALANIGTSAIAALNETLKHTESRLLAVRALAQIRRTETIEPLLSVVNDETPAVRTLAIEALSSFHDERILRVLMNALQDKVASVRKEAVIGIGIRAMQLNDPCWVEKVKFLLYDLNAQVCQQAAITLGRMGTEEATHALFKVLKSPATPAWFKLEIVRVLAWTESDHALSYLQEGLRWTDDEVALEIVTVLGRISSPTLKSKAVTILIEFLHSQQLSAQNVPVKQALAYALGELGDVEAVNALVKLATDSEAVVQLHAIAAFRKLPNIHTQLQQCLSSGSNSLQTEIKKVLAQL